MEVKIIALMLILAFGGVLLYAVLRRIGQRETPEKRAGRLGEVLVSNLIRDILNDDDCLLTNTKLKVDGQETEFDNLIINSHGLYIIEVKNYNGTLYGDEDDYEWTRIKITEAGYSYVSKVRNPIRQVNRQIYILSQFLKKQGFHIWIEGFVVLVRDNCPVNSPQVLHNKEEIESAIHRGVKTVLNDEEKNRLYRLLS